MFMVGLSPFSPPSLRKRGGGAAKRRVRGVSGSPRPASQKVLDNQVLMKYYIPSILSLKGFS